MYLVANERVTLPAGKYYVGDLCYVLHDIWKEYCELREDNIRNPGEHLVVQGREIVNFNTAYGDGSYQDHAGDFEFWVDSGTIGVIRYSDIIDEERKNIDHDGMQVLDFPKPFDVYIDEYHTIHIGNLAIPTDDATIEGEDNLYEEDWEDLTEDDIHEVEELIFSDGFDHEN
jgi:hypothetical protein